MKLISTDQISKGMVLAEDIVNDDGVIYLNTGIHLDQRHIRLLENLKVDYLYIVDEKEVDAIPTKAKKTHTQAFKKTLESFKSVYTNVRLGKQVVIHEVRDALDPLVDGILNNNDILGSLRNIEVNDEYTFKHSINVSLIASMLGKWIGMDKDMLTKLSVAGLLHDLGKCKIPHEILNKPGRLDSQEFEIMKTHSMFSYELLKASGQVDEAILKGIRGHHERIDGNGYPDRLKGDQIHLFAKIIAVADVFDAMTSDRCYQAKKSAFQVAEQMTRLGSDHLDITLVSVFLKNIAAFFVGNEVKLSNGIIGEIILINQFAVTRPLIRHQESFLDLSRRYDLDIIEVLK